MIRCVLFDLDGTLADTLVSIAFAGNKALKDMGFAPLPVENYKYYAGDGADVLIKRMLAAAGDKDLLFFDKAFSQYKSYFKDDCTYRVEPFSGIIELLEDLKQRNVKIGVISNKPHQRTVDVLDTLFGQNYFDVIAGQKDDVPKKPNPQSTLTAAAELNIPREACMYVGDTNVDMQTGMAAGMRTVGVLWGFRGREELEGYEPYAVIEKPSELLELL